MEKNKEIEAAFVSQVLTSPEILAETSIIPDMMTDPKNARIYQAVISIVQRGIKPDYVIIRQQDKDVDVNYLMQLADMGLSKANWKYYEKAIRDAWMDRKLIIMGRRLTNEGGTPYEKMQMVDEELGVLAGITGRNAVAKIGTNLHEHVGVIENRYNTRGKLPGLSTGLTGLDHVIMGLQRGLLYVIGARPSQGKSALALNMAGHLSVFEHVPIGYLSLESSTRELLDRMLSTIGRVDGTKIKTGYLAQGDFDRIQDAAGLIYEAPFFVYDHPSAILLDCKSAARFMARKHGIKALFVDYAQIVRVPGALDRRAAAEETSMEFKALARELDIPIVLLAQLGRSADEKRPGLADFQWTSQFEQDADVAGLIWHKYSKDNHHQIEESFLLMEKVRDGKRGRVPLKFEVDYVHFADSVEREADSESVRRMPYRD